LAKRGITTKNIKSNNSVNSDNSASQVMGPGGPCLLFDISDSTLIDGTTNSWLFDVKGLKTDKIDSVDYYVSDLGTYICNIR